jgi:CxxC motif-containing protein (DUF1111 family)
MHVRLLALAVPFVASAALLPVALSAPEEAPTGFDNLTNGFLSQTDFDANREIFDEQEEIDEGLGPVYNARSCGECHQTPVSGAISQITELRAGRLVNGNFVDHRGGSLINDRAIDPSIQERVQPGNDVRTLRTSLNTLGDGFVEAIADQTLEAIAASQPFPVRGQIIRVPVLEAPNVRRVARFGWKNQHASLVSFAADAYLNEMGITSPLAAQENTSLGRSVADFDEVADPEEEPTTQNPNGPDIDAFANFMRSTKAPPRDDALARTSDAVAGAAVFRAIGCAVCHVPDIVTAPAGTVINGGTFTVPAALGDKLIHPFSDFLLHDVGTGDGIVQNGGQGTRNKLRTPPLWGLRTRSRLMHDGESETRVGAIQRHRGQALFSSLLYQALSSTKQRQLLTFLDSL